MFKMTGGDDECNRAVRHRCIETVTDGRLSLAGMRRRHAWTLFYVLLAMVTAPLVASSSAPSVDESFDATLTIIASLISKAVAPAANWTFCPPPLIASPFQSSINITDPSRKFFCAQGCCLPCPSLKYVYPPGEVDKIWNYHIPIFFGIGTLGALGMLLTHVVVPTRRSSSTAPSIINLQLGLILLGGSMAFGIPEPKELHCVDTIERANGSTNTRCLIQGTLFTLGANLAILFASHLIGIQHLALVWNRGPDLLPLLITTTPTPKTVNKLRTILIQFTLWTMALLLTSLTVLVPSSYLGLGESGAIGDGLEAIPGLFCAVGRRRAWATFFGPQVGILAVAVCLQVSTGVTVAMLSRKKMVDQQGVATAGESGVVGLKPMEGRHGKRYIVMSQLRLQWRSGLMALVLLFSWVNLIALYTVTYLPQEQFHLLNNWTREWVICLFRNTPNGHAACSSIPRAWLPNLSGVLISLDLSALAGIYGILVFVVRRGILREWRQLLLKQRRRRRRRQRRKDGKMQDDDNLDETSGVGGESDGSDYGSEGGNVVVGAGKKDGVLFTIGGKDGVKGLAGVVVVAEGGRSSLASDASASKQKKSHGLFEPPTHLKPSSPTHPSSPITTTSDAQGRKRSMSDPRQINPRQPAVDATRTVLPTSPLPTGPRQKRSTSNPQSPVSLHLPQPHIPNSVMANVAIGADQAESTKDGGLPQSRRRSPSEVKVMPKPILKKSGNASSPISPSSRSVLSP
ncbi:hypothetical protein HDU67_003234 [Dinochytrium kinnereticum]|nr:hypothetical protein HDU67_003234 [Dinochytrium kinnereticum]